MYLFPSHANIGYDSDNINPNSRQQHDPPSSSFNFPSPNIHYEDDPVFLQHVHDLLYHQQQPPLINMADYTNKGDATKILNIPRKKTSKKDRHSKINTVRGPRDRRMRLSVDIAGRFFGLQDVLGFDKASKTVEWLLNKSKTAIKELIKVKNSCSVGGTNTASSNSTLECEVLSHRSITFTGSDAKASNPSCIKEKKVNGFRRKTAFDHPLARESREKARARARERTRDKMRKLEEESKVMACAEGIMNVDELSRLGSWSPFENGKEYSGSQICNVIHSSFEVQEQPISCSWSPSTLFGYHHNSGISHEHPFTDFQAYGKPWEAYDK